MCPQMRMFPVMISQMIVRDGSCRRVSTATWRVEITAGHELTRSLHESVNDSRIKRKCTLVSSGTKKEDVFGCVDSQCRH